MEEILFHIGYHKTATTWLQKELFVSTSKNFVPLSKNKKGHSTLARDFIYDQEGYLLSSFENNEQKIISNYKQLLNRFNKEERRIRVVSHERLSGNPHSSGFDAALIVKRIKNVFPSSRILIVIREQTSWILSNYFQYLAIGGTDNLKRYLTAKYDGKRPGFSPSHIMYHLLIQNYYDEFGKDKVLVLPYEMLNSDKHAFLKSMGIFLNRDLSNETPNFDKRINEKSDQYLNYKFRFINPLISSSSVNNNSALNKKVTRNIITEVKKRIGLCIPKGKNELIKYKLKGEIMEWSADRYNQSNQITQDLIGMNLGVFGYQTTTNK